MLISYFLQDGDDFKQKIKDLKATERNNRKEANEKEKIQRKVDKEAQREAIYNELIKLSKKKKHKFKIFIYKE